MDIQLPHNPAEKDQIWKPREYQQGVWSYLENGGKRANEIWHRRSGKDEFCLAWAGTAAHERIGTYWHMLPEQTQARKAIWEAVDPHRGLRRIDLAFPKEIRETTREAEMFIRFKCGSTWQVLGSDRFDSLVGTPPIGVVFSEWALSHPHAWAYLRPILLENNGWALFLSTPRGKNHCYTMHQNALASKHWHTSLITARETDVFTEAQLDMELSEYIAEHGVRMGTALFNQEYLCSWESAIPGAYWAEELNQLERDGRFTDVPHNPDLPVITSVDLGMNDENVTFYWQVHGAQIMMINCMVHRAQGLQAQIKDRNATPYNIIQDIAPFDIKVRELGTGKSRYEVAQGLGVQYTVAPKMSVMDGIDAFRRIIPRLWVDKTNCGEAFEILKGYRAQYDEKKQILSKNPLHDFSSNWADSVRYYAITPHVQADSGGPLDYSKMDNPSRYARQR